MTQIVASRQRREMFAIEENHTSPIATVTSSNPLKRYKACRAVDPVDERRHCHPHGIVRGDADEAGPEHPQAEGGKRDQPGHEFHAAGELRQRRRPDRGPERREEE
jgi:hypothetical protein